LCWTKGNFEQEREELFFKSKAKICWFSSTSALKIKNEWTTGFFSIADFWLFGQLHLIYELDKTKLKEYPNLYRFREKFVQTPEIDAHRKSPEFLLICSVLD